jgi:hypothetical protein
MLATPGDQLRGTDARPWRRHDEGHADLAHALVGHADHGRGGDLGMLEELALDLGRIDVESAHDEHVLDAVRDLQIALLVHDPDVAGVEPALGIDRPRGLLRILEIAPHHVVSAHPDLAGLAARDLAAGLVDADHLGVRERATIGVRDRLGIVSELAGGDRAAALGQTVGLDHVFEAELVAHAAHELDGGRRGAGDGEP